MEVSFNCFKRTGTKLGFSEFPAKRKVQDTAYLRGSPAFRVKLNVFYLT